jgi:bacterial/archaeal transporter family protein
MNWLALAVGSAIAQGMSDIFKKQLLNKEHTLQFLASFTLIGMLVSLVGIQFLDLSFPPQTWGLVLLKTVLLSFAGFFFMKSLKHLEMSEVMPLRNLSPLILVFLSYFILGEKLTPLKYLGIFVLIFGIYILEANKLKAKIAHHVSIIKNKYFLYMTGFLVLISFCSILDKFIMQSIKPYTFLLIQFILLGIVYNVWHAFKYKSLVQVKNAFTQDWKVAIPCAALMVGSDLMYFTAVAIPTAYISVIIPIKRLSSVMATFVGGEKYHEHDLKSRVAACIILVVGAVLLAL